MAITLSHSFTMSAANQEAMAPHFCEIHTVEAIRGFCTNCDELVCMKCIVGSHKGHEIDEIANVANVKKDELVEIFNDVQDKRVPDVEEKLEKIQKLKVKNTHDTEKTVELINKRDNGFRVQLKRMTKVCTDEARKVERKNTERITISEAKLMQSLNVFRKCIDMCNDAKDSGDNIHVISTLKNVVTMAKSTVCDVPIIYPPRFIPGDIGPELLETKFGNVPDDFEMEISSDTFLFGTRPLKSIKQFSTGIVILTPYADNKALVRCHKSSNVNLIDTRGAAPHVINVGTKIDDVALADGNLLLSCPDIKEVIECTADGRINKTVFKTNPLIPCGICKTYRNSFLVCLTDNVSLSRSEGSRRCVKEINPSGDIINTIEFDGEKPLFTFPSGVSAARNGNIAVLDWTQPKTGRVLMFDPKGKLIFIYPSQGDVTNVTSKIRFWPGSCSFDPSCNLLVTDMVTRSVYLIDTSRNMGKLMETTRDTFPRAIGISEDGKIWIGHYDGKIEILELTR